MWRLGGGRSAVFVETSIMAHPPSGSVQTECVRMPYDAPPLFCGRICQGASISHQVGGNAERELENISVTVAGPLLQSNDDGMDELEFQTVLHILVHAHIRDAVAVVQGAGAELVYVARIVAQHMFHSYCIPSVGSFHHRKGQKFSAVECGFLHPRFPPSGMSAINFKRNCFRVLVL